jgi:hypothetical protein
MPRKKTDPWFKKETISSGRVEGARSSENWEQLVCHLEELSDARQSMFEAAKNGKRVQIIDSMELADEINSGGRYLIRPPLVGRDAGIISNSLHSNNISAIVLCREPSTSLGLCPIVSLGSGVMVRVQIEDPTNAEKPTCAWFDHAIDELGDHVLGKMNTQSTPLRQLDYVLAHIPAVPTHVGLYKAAIVLCQTLQAKTV